MEPELILQTLANSGESLPMILDILEKDLNMPNLKLPGMDAGVFWDDIAEYKGWKMQQNTLTKSARILDADGVRVAWGTINGMQKVMTRYHQGFIPEPYGTHSERMGNMDELEKLKRLFDNDVITEDEFKEKKAAIMKRL